MAADTAWVEILHPNCGTSAGTKKTGEVVELPVWEIENCLLPYGLARYCAAPAPAEDAAAAPPAGEGDAEPPTKRSRGAR